MENKARKSPVNQNQKIQKYTIGKSWYVRLFFQGIPQSMILMDKKTFQEMRGHHYQEINTGKFSIQVFSGTGECKDTHVLDIIVNPQNNQNRELF